MTKSEWRGFPRLDFEWNGRACILVRPENARADGAWIWRAEFFDAFAQVDEAMARLGYCVAYARLSDRYGCPSAVEDMAAFHTYMTREYGLSERAIVEGFSRGGLYAANYALACPQRVDKLYLDAPVLDIRSWPGRMPDSREWRECLACYGLTPETAKDFTDGPLFHAKDLAKSRIPIALVAGGADEAVPIGENSAPFSEAFRAAGGNLLYIVKPHCGHHPHSLEDPAPVVEFLTGREA